MPTSPNARAEDVFDYTVTFTLSDGSQVDITDLVHSVQIHQSIFAPAMTAKLFMNDSVNFINKQPIIGEEKVAVKFRSADAETPITYNFVVNGADDFDFNTNLKELTYTIWCVSAEAYTDFTGSVQKSYRTPINEIVQDIYTTYLKSTKTVQLEKTKGQTGLVIPNLTPFQSLNFLKKRAISAENPTDVFMSYEATDGFHFQTVANMVKLGKNKADSQADHRFVYQHSSVVDPTTQSLSGSVIEFKPHRKFEVNELMQGGYFAATVQKFNLDTGEFTSEDFRLADKIGSWALSQQAQGSTLHTPKFMAAFNTSHKQYTIPFDPYRIETSMADVIAAKNAYFLNLLQNQFEIVVPGADTVLAGEMINVDMPELAAPEASDTVLQNQTAGYFIISDVIHTVANRSKYTTKFVAFKDSYSKQGDH